MVFLSKTFGFQTLGPFYVMNKIFGLLLIRENDNKVTCSKNVLTDGDTDSVFRPDARYLAYSAVLLLWFYWTVRRCVSLVGGWPCGDAVGCSSAVEWIVSAAVATQAVVAVAVAAMHRRSETAALMDHTYAVLSAGGRSTAHRTHRAAAGAYAAVSVAVVVVRSVAVVIARPDRFATADVLLLCVPAACVPIALECVVVCVCSALEQACCDVVDRLDRLAAAAAEQGDAARGKCRPAAFAVAAAAMHQPLEALWRDHWRGCRLVGLLSKCYGLDLAVDLTANMLFFIVYAYVTLLSLYASSSSPSSAAVFYWNVALVCQLAGVSFRIVFISYRAEKVKQVAENSVLISLRNLLKNNNLDNSTIMLVNAFTYQIMNRELKLSACGFFSINLSFFHALIRLATTYLIVIIQYNSEPLQTSSKPV